MPRPRPRRAFRSALRAPAALLRDPVRQRLRRSLRQSRPIRRRPSSSGRRSRPTPAASSSYCVRTLRRPLLPDATASRNANPAQLCNSFCPASQDADLHRQRHQLRDGRERRALCRQRERLRLPQANRARLHLQRPRRVRPRADRHHRRPDRQAGRHRRDGRRADVAQRQQWTRAAVNLTAVRSGHPSAGARAG